MRATVLPYVLATLLAALIAASAYLVLGACGLSVPFVRSPISFCVASADWPARERLAALAEARGALETKVSQLEGELAKLQCVAHPAAGPDSAAVPPAIDADAFARRDLGAMQGCWRLMTQFNVLDEETGTSKTFDQWNVCLKADGTGTEELRATDGTPCRGTLTGAFNAAGDFEIDKPGDLNCESGLRIYKTQASCNLDAAGRAICDLRQPQTGGTERVELRRAGGGN